MIRRIVGWVVLVPFCLVLIVFALANTQSVQLYFNPFEPHRPIEGAGVPLFLVIFTVLLFGVVLGGVATWFAQGQHRRDERSYSATERLNREVDILRRSPALPLVDDLAKS